MLGGGELDSVLGGGSAGHVAEGPVWEGGSLEPSKGLTLCPS